MPERRRLLICVFSAMELANCFAFVRGAIVPRQRKCLHFYFYLIDRELGFMHVRIQSWFPFQIQIYLNGRECLGRFQSRVVDGRRHGKLNPVAAKDCHVFQTVMAGEQTISGFRNRDLTARLFPVPCKSPEEARQRCARTSRLIAKLRGHGLPAEVPGSRRYRVTLRGHRVMSAALRFRQVDFPRALAA